MKHHELFTRRRLIAAANAVGWLLDVDARWIDAYANSKTPAPATYEVHDTITSGRVTQGFAEAALSYQQVLRGRLRYYEKVRVVSALATVAMLITQLVLLGVVPSMFSTDNVNYHANWLLVGVCGALTVGVYRMSVTAHKKEQLLRNLVLHIDALMRRESEQTVVVFDELLRYLEIAERAETLGRLTSR